METAQKIIFSILFVFAFGSSKACQCPLSNLSLNECEKYEVIFRGKVLDVKSCGDKPGEAQFEVLELYKGNASEKFKILFRCDEECAYLFKPGEEWIIYSRYKQVNTAMMDWCSRSRRYFSNLKEDYYTSTYGNDYEEELAFLRTHLGQHRLLKGDATLSQSRNQIPGKAQTAVLLICSILGIVLFYLIFKKFFQ